MDNKNFSIGGLLQAVLGVAFVAGVLVNFVNGKPIMAALCVVGAMVFIGGAKTAFSKKSAKADTASYLTSGAGGEKLVQKVLDINNYETIMDDTSLAAEGVKLVGISNNHDVALVLTENCVYESIFGSYDYPRKGIARLRFKKGPEVIGETRVQLDEGRMARAGFMAGGLGVAAMNYAEAVQTNAEGGAKVGVNSGCFSFMMEVGAGGDNTTFWILLARKDIDGEFPKIFEGCHKREGKAFNAYFVSRMGGGTCERAAKAFNDLLPKL